MDIVDVLALPVRSGFFVDDQLAIRAGAVHDGFGYAGEPVTAGFRAIRQAGEALSVMVVLDDGSVEFGDCAAVQYSGAGGREPAFDAVTAREQVLRDVAPALIGVPVTGFRDLAALLERLDPCVPAAVRYGVSQALLAAAARAARVTMAEVVREEYRTGAPLTPVPLYAQSGEDRFVNAEKMILKRADVLPHGLINSPAAFGPGGDALADYVRWLVARIAALRPDPDYRPRLHLDTYGIPGLVFGGDVAPVADYLVRLGELAAPYDLAVEHPIDTGSTPAQIETYSRLRIRLQQLGSSVRLVVDEWCNTLADVRDFAAAQAADVVHVKMPDLGSIADSVTGLLLVREAGLEAYCGGTCNETDRSAQVAAHVAMACRASQVLARPGMGVDEGLMIVGNEMIRTAALAARRGGAPR